MKLERSQVIPADIDQVWEFFADPHNLARITPDSMAFTIVEAPDRPLRLDDVIRYRIAIAHIPLRWISRIVEWHERKSFTDLQIEGPYRRWHHRHSFEPVAGGVVMKDVVDYELPFGHLGRLVAGRFVNRRLEAIFDHRAASIRQIFSTSGTAA